MEEPLRNHPFIKARAARGELGVLEAEAETDIELV